MGKGFVDSVMDSSQTLLWAAPEQVFSLKCYIIGILHSPVRADLGLLGDLVLGEEDPLNLAKVAEQLAEVGLLRLLGEVRDPHRGLVVLLHPRPETLPPLPRLLVSSLRGRDVFPCGGSSGTRSTCSHSSRRGWLRLDCRKHTE